MSRNKMLTEYRHWCNLTEKEQTWILNNKINFGNICEAIEKGSDKKKNGGACANINRIAVLKDIVKMIKNPATNMDDNPNEIVYNEEKLLGVALTCSRVDSCDTSMVNTSCKEFIDGKKGFMILGVHIQSIREVTIKKGNNQGKKMAFLTISDGTCSIADVCAFPEAYKEFSSLLNEGNTVIIQGKRDSKKDSLIIETVQQI